MDTGGGRGEAESPGRCGGVSSVGREGLGHMPKPEEAASQPQPRRHSPTARSSQRHAPSADTARASQERRGRGKRREGFREGGAKVSTRELDKTKEKINGKEWGGGAQKIQVRRRLRDGGRR